MAVHLTGQRAGFATGWTEITPFEESQDGTGMAFAILRLAAGASFEDITGTETAWLLMSGTLEVEAAGQTARWQRNSLFDDPPAALHLPGEVEFRFRCETEAELACFRVPNFEYFEPRIYAPEQVRDEVRGQGQADGAATRTVRTIVDDENGPPEAWLVLGEVVHAPGRWSSYPPHHHPQPEIYHYRFTRPQGYGHAELGQQVLRVEQYDTVKILDGLDHAQVAAPGYGMYYIWAIRHLKDQRYTVPEFTEAHRWTLEADAEFWQPEWARR